MVCGGRYNQGATQTLESPLTRKSVCHFLFLVTKYFSYISFISAVTLVFWHDLYSKFKCGVNSDIKVHTMQLIMNIRYIKSFYIYIQGLSWWCTIFNPLDTNTFKAAQSNEIVKSSNPKQFFRLHSIYRPYSGTHINTHMEYQCYGIIVLICLPWQILCDCISNITKASHSN